MRYRVLTFLLAAALLSGCSQGTADAPEPAEITNAQTTQAETTTEAFVPPPAEYETADNSAEILAAAQEQTEQMRQRFGDDIPAFEPAELVTIIENPDEMTYSGIFEWGIQYGQKRYTYIIRDSHGNDIGEILQPENEMVFNEAYVYDSDGHIIKDYILHDDNMTIVTDTYENGVLKHGMFEQLDLEDGELKPVLESCYDEHGNLLESYDFKDGTKARGLFNENEYDENGRLVCSDHFGENSEGTPHLWTLRYKYDDEGKMILKVTEFGSSYSTLKNEYFSFGSLRRETTLDYYENGDLANKSVIEYSYDDPDHLHQIVEYEQGKQTYKAIFKYKIIDNT
jgi:predicted DNA-binding antitoxin AbrB/MazE fold protein